MPEGQQFIHYSKMLLLQYSKYLLLHYTNMIIIFLLIIISLIVALGFLAAFIWAVKDGQYDDDYTPAIRILFDDTKHTTKEE